MTQLISKDAKGKLRVAELSYDWDEENRIYTLHRTTYQYGGKRTEQPDKFIERGKATRNIHQQLELEFNHLKKEYLDKGYKELEKDISEYTEKELFDIVGTEITGQDGVVKPMLAKQEDKVTKRDIFNKEWYASRKIDGLRCLIYLGKDGKVHTASRGAMNYDAAMSDIIKHPTLVKLFEKNPWLILDGEAYRAFLPLNVLSGVARTQKTAADYDILQFYWYDIVDTNKSFKERLKIMNAIKNALKLDFDPYRQFEDDELRVQFVPQVPVSGWNNMMKLHNEYVEAGWEGLVIRDPDCVYGPNKRTNAMVKIKVYKVDTFRVIGLEQGLRMYDDMCFIMETLDGKQFKAKPMGDHSQKVEYTDNFEENYKGHLGDVKYFADSKNGVVTQPCFISFRFDLE